MNPRRARPRFRLRGSIDRRRFLQSAALGAGGAALGLSLAGCDSEALPSGLAGGEELAFRHGVASGDPMADRVMLWTRISGATAPVEVAWEVARDAAFEDVVRSDRQPGDSVFSATTEAARDYSFKVDVIGLQPATTYHYRFRVGDVVSPVGQTRTAPDGMASRMRFALVSCSNYATGFFNPYKILGRLPLRERQCHRAKAARPALRDRHAGRLPAATRPVPQRPRPAGDDGGAPLDRDLGRSRVHQ
jgi:alkaline phosphatase D